MLNGSGTLVTSDGFPVLGTNGQIVFSRSDKDIAINKDGSITTSEGLRGRLRVAMFDNPQALVNEGANLYSGGNARQATAAETQLVSGAVERSNVRPVIEMARMVEISRAYTSIAQMIQRTDDLRRTAIQRLADLQT